MAGRRRCCGRGQRGRRRRTAGACARSLGCSIGGGEIVRGVSRGPVHQRDGLPRSQCDDERAGVASHAPLARRRQSSDGMGHPDFIAQGCAQCYVAWQVGAADVGDIYLIRRLWVDFVDRSSPSTRGVGLRDRSPRCHSAGEVKASGGRSCSHRGLERSRRDVMDRGAGCERAAAIRAFLEATRFVLLPPTSVLEPRPGVWEQWTAREAVTRVPWDGENAVMGTPSVLDYVAAQEGVVRAVDVSWRLAPADHAFVVASLERVPDRCVRRSRKWHVTARWDTVVQVATDLMRSQPPEDVYDLRILARQLQEELRDKRTCAQRRRDRIPMAVRSAWARAAQCGSPAVVAKLRKHATALLRTYAMERAAGVADAQVRRGGVPVKRSPLRQITAVTREGGVTTDADEMAELICNHFSAKWHAGDEARKLSLLNAMFRLTQKEVVFSSNELTAALWAMKRPRVVSSDGTCSDAWYALFLGNA